jgi:hypothetical protein
VIRKLSTPVSKIAAESYGAFFSALYLAGREESLKKARDSQGITRLNHLRIAKALHKNMLRAMRDYRQDKARAASYRAAALGAGSFAERLLGSVS